jgi:hypothetical protein
MGIFVECLHDLATSLIDVSGALLICPRTWTLAVVAGKAVAVVVSFYIVMVNRWCRLKLLRMFDKFIQSERL